MMQSKISKFCMISSIAAIFLLAAPFAHVSASTGGTYGPPVVPGPDPPLNPTALYAVSGSYNYTAAGTALRNTGSGVITVSYTGTVVAAYLIWGIINPSNAGLDAANINGNPITGTLQSTDASPCWGNGNLSVFAAVVTSYVVNGANTVSGFASGITTGQDPWSAATAPLDDGASLVVVTTGTSPQQVYIYTGSYTEPSAGNPLTSVFNHGAAIATTAQTTFIVADGQLANNYAQYNGVTINSNAFPGSDPKTSAATWSYGNLWDTKTYSVPEALSATTDSAGVGSNSGDCLTWAGQVIMIPSTAPIITGVPQFGAPPVMIAAIGIALVAFFYKRKSGLQITR